jgi:UrcA family protein
MQQRRLVMSGIFGRSKNVALALTLASCLAATPAAAAQGQPVTVYAERDANVRTARVSYADLDLASAKGERTLVRRVARAVKKVCLFEDGQRTLQDSSYYSCERGAWDDAKPQIALASQRARDIAMNGSSKIAAAAIRISVQ